MATDSSAVGACKGHSEIYPCPHVTLQKVAVGNK